MFGLMMSQLSQGKALSQSQSMSQKPKQFFSAWDAKKKRDFIQKQHQKRDASITASTTPTIAAALKKRTTRTFSAVNTTIDSSAADSTNTATSIGAADYSFAPRESYLVNATLTPSAAAASAATATPTSGASGHYIAIRDTSSIVQLSANTDGNIYLTPYPGASPGTAFLSTGSVVTIDDESRSFHYYPDTMAAYGVSRLRLSTTANATVDSQIITLIPTHSPLGPIYTAIDTLGHMFLFAWCNAPDWPGAKVFLIKDSTGPQMLQSSEIQWVVTGNKVTKCAPLLLTSGEQPLI
jgi:hypothetical protein